MAKPELKKRAIGLRVDGRKSIKEISVELGVSQSSVSVWLKGFPLTDEELKVRYHKQRWTKTLDGIKWCPGCRDWKCIDAFAINVHNSSGRRSWCSLCTNEKKRKKKYGIKPGELQSMWDEQGGFCGICGDPLVSMQSAHLDHDHTTGAIRGLLCRCCNLGLGWFRDNTKALRSAIEYIEKHGVAVKLESRSRL